MINFAVLIVYEGNVKVGFMATEHDTASVTIGVIMNLVDPARRLVALGVREV